MVVGCKRGQGIKVVFGNAQSIVNKMNETRATLSILDPEIFAVTESWANCEIGNELLHISGYELIVRLDRNDTDRGRGGGILIYAKKDVDVLAEEIKTDFNQCAALKIKNKGGDIH